VPAFFTAPNLRTLLFPQAGYIGFLSYHGLMVVPSPQAACAVKNRVLHACNGALGLEVLTPQELRSHRGKLMAFEGSVVLAALCGSLELKTPQRIYHDAELFCRAGYPLEEIPLPDFHREGLFLLRDFLKKKRLVPSWEGSFLPPDRPVALLGFGPVEALEIVREHHELFTRGAPVVGVIEPEPLTREQMAALGSLEELLGEPLRLEEEPSESFHERHLTVASAMDFVGGVARSLQSVERLVYDGVDAEAALRLLSQQGGVELGGKYPWAGAEELERFVRAQASSNWMARWELFRAACAWAGVDHSAEEKKARAAIQDAGALEETFGSFVPFPERMTLSEFQKALPELWGKPLEQKLKKLSRLLPADAALAKTVWLDLLLPPQREQRFYGGPEIVSAQEALGLVDGRTLLLRGTGTPLGTDSFLDKSVVAHLNGLALEGPEDAPRLRRGWIYLHENLTRTQALSARAGCLLELAPAGRAPSAAFEMPPCVSVPRTRRGYELPAPVEASCKQWETLLQTPEVGWFELNRLRPLWSPETHPQESLWVGNWVHAAMNPQRAEDLAGRLRSHPQAPPVWRMALTRAWALARSFQRELSGARILEAESPQRGTVNSVPTHGIIDALLKKDDRTILIDYKSSAQAGKIPMPRAGADKLAQKADGFQIWLYGRLLEALHPGLEICRLSQGSTLEDTRCVEGPPLESEERMHQIYTTGAPGAGARTFQRYGGARGRLPLATRAHTKGDDDDGE
jgi:hypothetical protein